MAAKYSTVADVLAGLTAGEIDEAAAGRLLADLAAPDSPFSVHTVDFRPEAGKATSHAMLEFRGPFKPFSVTVRKMSHILDNLDAVKAGIDKAEAGEFELQRGDGFKAPAKGRKAK